MPRQQTNTAECDVFPQHVPFSWYVGVGMARISEGLVAIGLKKSDYFCRWAAKQLLLSRSSLPELIDEYDRRHLRDIHNGGIEEWRRLSLEVFKRDNYTCVYCEARGGRLEPDHLIPIVLGGTDVITNLATACMRCNRQKRSKTPLEFVFWKVTHDLTESRSGLL